MLQNGSEKDESIDTLDARAARALTEYMSVLPGVGPARDAPDLYLVVSQSGREYLVDARTDACECADARHRDPDGGCKHAARVAFATGARAIPVWTDAGALDPDLAEHVDGGLRVAAPDGGQLAADAAGDTAAGDAPLLDADARLAVHDIVLDLLAPRLSRLLSDFSTWMVTVEIAADATTAACLNEAAADQ